MVHQPNKAHQAVVAAAVQGFKDFGKVKRSSTRQVVAW
jgi:hypothetical protein